MATVLANSAPREQSYFTSTRKVAFLEVPVKTVALIAHDRRKSELVDWVESRRPALAPFRLVATGTTGTRIRERLPDLEIKLLKSGPLGGDQQVGALIAEGEVAAMIFFIDPLTPMPHDVDVKALTRLAVLYDVPLALNPRTADLLVSAGLPET